MQAKTVVVEDDLMTRRDAVMLIEEAACEVPEMATADQALSYIRRQPTPIAALFSDVQAPGHTSGADVARMVSCRWPKIRLLVTFGHRAEGLGLPSSSRFLPKSWVPLDVLMALMGTGRAAEGGRLAL